METKEKQRLIRANYKPVFEFVRLSVKRILDVRLEASCVV